MQPKMMSPACAAPELINDLFLLWKLNKCKWNKQQYTAACNCEVTMYDEHTLYKNQAKNESDDGDSEDD